MIGHPFANAEEFMPVTHRLPQPFQQKPGLDEIIQKRPVEEPVVQWPDIHGRLTVFLRCYISRNTANMD